MSDPTDPLAAGQPGGADRRGFPRRRKRGTALIRPPDKPFAPGTRITLVDISQSGIGFVSPKELPVGQAIQIELETSSVPGRPKGTLLAEVRWIAPADPPGQFRVGCAFTSRLSYADLLHFS